MKFIQRFLIPLLIASFLFYALGRYYFYLTDGFSLSAIMEVDKERQPFDQEAPPLKELQMSYRYLAKGTQSYVLVSDDGKTVMKCFKKKHLAAAWWSDLEWPFYPLKEIARSHKLRRLAKREKIFTGCELAFEEMREESALLYLHLSPTKELPSEMILIDKMGRSFTFNPNDYAFYLQKKVEPFYEAMKRCRDKKDLVEAKLLLSRLFSYLLERCSRGLLDPDPNYLMNVGFDEGRPVTIDVGNLRHDPLIANPIESLRRIKDYTRSLPLWAKNHYPPLIELYWEELQLIEESISQNAISDN